MDQGEAGASFWESFYRPHPVIFALLVFLGLDLEFVAHYWFGITIVYTQFFYLIIVVAGLWYGRRAVWVALLFGSLHVLVTYFMTGLLSPDALMRAVVMLIVAYAVGTIVEQKQAYCDRLAEQNRALSGINEQPVTARAQIAKSPEAGEASNSKKDGT
jgi:hypothetical protein